jgi:hypothetical protein
MNNEIKREMTLEELEAEYAKKMAKCENMRLQIEQKKREEDDRKKAQLALDKEKRKNIIDEKEKELAGLIREYIKDYGSFNTHYYSDDERDVFSYLYHLFF